MLSKHQPTVLILCAVLALSACGNRRGGASSEAAHVADTMAFSYARLLTIERHEGYQVARVANPWKPGKTLHTYVLVPRAAGALPQELPEGTVVRIPLERSIVFTSVHCALIDQLGAQQRLAGVADLKYIKVPFVQEGCRTGVLADCGDGMSPVVERIIDAEADAILLSPFENSGGYGRLEEIDIPLIECAEYMEASPLARAEWMRFYGLLYGQQQRADSLFAIVDSSYHALAEQARHSGPEHSVIMDQQTGSVWYMPGGRSTIGQMLQDAQCSYPFAADEHSGSLSLPFETVLERGGQCDTWMLRYDRDQPMTLHQLLAAQPGYGQLSAVDKGRVYGCNVKTSLFYEETPFRPDLLLHDFISILHSEQPDSLHYYHLIR